MLFSLNHSPDSVALCTESDVWSYARLLDASEEIARAVGGRTLTFLLCTNTPESIAGYVACVNHRVVPAMVDGELDEELLTRLVEIYRPSYLWMPRGRRGEFGGYREVFSLGTYVLLASEETNPYPLHEDLALLMTTSGSTGSPKFVRLSYGNLRSNTESIIKYLEIDRGERSITNLPMHYVYGLSIINTHLKAGASLVVTEKTLFQKEFWQLFKEKEVTNFGGVPYTFEMLKRLRFFRMDLPHLQTITQAGGKLDPELHRAFAEYAEKEGKRFIVMYGASEATARMGYLPARDSLRKIGSMGIAIPGGRFELMDEAGSVIEASDTPGELVYYGENVMMGYARGGADLAKGDEMGGCLSTGDLAARDEEGFYTIVGRKKRFLKMFGKRTNLEEAEHLLRQRFPAGDFAVGGRDDCMVIFFTETGAEGDLIPYLSRKMGLHPTGFRTKRLEEIPKNAAGKTLYRELEGYYDL